MAPDARGVVVHGLRILALAALLLATGVRFGGTSAGEAWLGWTG